MSTWVGESWKEGCAKPELSCVVCGSSDVLKSAVFRSSLENGSHSIPITIRASPEIEETVLCRECVRIALMDLAFQLQGEDS